MRTDFLPFACALGALLLLLSAGCSSPRLESRTDAFDDVRVEQIHGNTVSGGVIGKYVITLNPRVETRPAPLVTNVALSFKTNVVVSWVTNVVLTASTNQNSITSTNVATPPPQAPPAPTPKVAEGEAAAPAPDAPAPGGADSAPGEAAVAAAPAPAAPPVPQVSTNVTANQSLNVAVTRAPNQTSVLSQAVVGTSTQVSVTTNNVTLTTQLTQTLNFETNQVVFAVTNQTVTAVTNVTVSGVGETVVDWLLFTEILAPADFVQSPAEPLVLSIDGVRHSLPTTPSATAFVGRRGYQTTLYKASAELIEAIGAAKEVRMRIKGVNAVLERTLPDDCVETIRRFVAGDLKPKDASKPEARAQQAPAGAS